MFNSAVLDVAIGLVFLFCLVSLGASMLREAIEGLLKTRAVMLEQGIRELVGEAELSDVASTVGSLTRELFEHPQISSLFSGSYPDRLTAYRWSSRSPGRISFGSMLPSYIPSRNFALALLDRVGRGSLDASGAAPADMAQLDLKAIRARVALLPSGKLRRGLLVSLDSAGDDLEAGRLAVEQWYNSAMDRIAGWYRRETQAILLAIGLGLAVLLNIDAVAIGQRLLVDEQWRNALVATAQSEAQQQPTTPTIVALEGQLRDNGFLVAAPLRPTTAPLAVLGVTLLPAGRFAALVTALPGYLIIALATSLGAPFWFDLLNRLIVIRSTVKPHEKSVEEGSKDRPRERTTPRTPAPAPTMAGVPGTAATAALSDSDSALLDMDPALRPREGAGNISPAR